MIYRLLLLRPPTNFAHFNIFFLTFPTVYAMFMWRKVFSQNMDFINTYSKNYYKHMGVDMILELGGRGGGGAELEVGRKMCDHTNQYVNTPTYSAYITAII